ncbi:hypothetical protein [Devosia sp. Root685]|uniref:hypothetical protein n=1 Tax=Devosia sp. Root685 TaxID=1736587 RepID=UPI001AEBF443|nr:hypothetical protein [Devosia sp. Root685]
MSNALFALDIEVAGPSRSKNHHWWPVGLQSYWSDRNGDVSWIDPDGSVGKKKSANRQIGYKIHGHTMLRGGVWETNFESDFDIDDQVHDIIAYLRQLSPLGHTLSEFMALLRLGLKKDRKLADLCKIHHISDQRSRDLLLLLYSLLIRSPSNRFKNASFPSHFGLPMSDDVGKANMRQSYLLAKGACQSGVLTNRFFVVLHSDWKNFICGDGYLDWLSGSLPSVRGRALIPLTPNLCIYVCTPRVMRKDRNCASLRAAPWMVDQINEIVQIYSKDKLFFRGRRPQLTNEFTKRQFLEHSDYSVDLLDMFDEIAEPKSKWSWNRFGSITQ